LSRIEIKKHTSLTVRLERTHPAHRRQPAEANSETRKMLRESIDIELSTAVNGLAQQKKKKEIAATYKQT
jgi:hypothetical protein